MAIYQPNTSTSQHMQFFLVLLIVGSTLRLPFRGSEAVKPFTARAYPSIDPRFPQKLPTSLYRSSLAPFPLSTPLLQHHSLSHLFLRCLLYIPGDGPTTLHEHLSHIRVGTVLPRFRVQYAILSTELQRPITQATQIRRGRRCGQHHHPQCR